MFRFPPKRILAPVDLSEQSWASLRWARALAEKFDADLECLYVVEMLPLAPDTVSPLRLDPGLRRRIREKIQAKAGPRIKIRILDGEAVSLILRTAEARRTDLIVMGTHGRRGFNRLWLGSVAESVVRLSPVPVLTVRGDVRDIHSILVPLNFTEYARRALDFAGAVGKALHATLTAFHVNTDPNHRSNPRFWLENAVAGLPARTAAKCRVAVQASGGSAVEGILKEASSQDLIVLAAHQKPLLQDMVLGMTAERVLRYSPIPVLTVPTVAIQGRRKHPAPKEVMRAYPIA